MRFNQTWKAAICGGENKDKYFPANVPGNVQRDYAEFLGLKNLHYGRTLKALESTENERWSYKTALDYAEKPDERVYFVAEGIDYAYDIRLNGETIFSGEGMYTPVEIDITDTAKPGDELEVIIRPHPKAEAGRAALATKRGSRASRRSATAGTGIRACSCLGCGCRRISKRAGGILSTLASRSTR